MNITYLLDRMAEAFPDRGAILTEADTVRSWAETRDRVDRTAEPPSYMFR